MKITFIRPNLMEGRAGDTLEPLAFSILSSLTPGNVERRLVDERVEPIPMDEPTDLAAITVDTFAARRAYQIAAQYRRRNVPVVLGGPHPTLCTKEALGFADTVVTGDAEDTWPALVEDARRGRRKRLYASRFPPLGPLRCDRRIFGRRRYGFVRVVQFGRGCPHACDFCSVHAIFGDRIRYRPVADVAADVEQAGPGVLFFVDDNLFADTANGLALCDALKPLRARWVAQVSLAAASDKVLVGRMAGSGCVMAIVGFESMSGEVLRDMGKEWNRRYGAYEGVVKRLRESGIMVYGTFVLGYDADTPDTVKACVEFAVRSKLALAGFNPLMPFPGTALYDRLAREKRLLYDSWWLAPEYRYGRIPFRPRRMTPEQLEESCYAAKTEFNRAGSLLGRALDWSANTHNLGVFLAVNLATRREIRRKQGGRLGANENIEPFFHDEAHAG